MEPLRFSYTISYDRKEEGVSEKDSETIQSTDRREENVSETESETIQST